MLDRVLRNVCTVAWADPAIRFGLMQLLSYTVRQAREAALSPEAPNLESWGRVLRAVLLSAEYALRTELAPCVCAEVVQLLVRADLPQCVARLFAAMMPRLQPAVIAAAAADSDAAAGMEDGNVEAAVLHGSTEVFSALCGFVRTARACSCFLATGPQAVQEAGQQLRAAVLRSKLLEHAARAVALLPTTSAAVQLPVESAVALGPSCTAAPKLHRDPQSPCRLKCDTALLLKTVVITAAYGDRRVVVWANALLSGPNVQYFLLLHAVSQLCAADGGTDYGLPVGVRLPPLRGEEEEAAGAGRLAADIMARTFYWWAANPRAQPCSDRALRAVCLRAAAAASASAFSAAGAGGSGGGSARWQFGPPGDAVAMAIAALKCAIARTFSAVAAVSGSAGGAANGARKASSSHFRQLWAPVVCTADAAVRIPPTSSLANGDGPLELLLTLPQPDLVDLLTDEGLLPPQPGPDLAAVLDAGYVAALERTIRSAARTAFRPTTAASAAGSQAGNLELVLPGIGSLLRDVRGLASLMAYGELTQVASLLASCFKVVARAHRGGNIAPAGLAGLLEVVSAAWRELALWDGRGAGPADKRWWEFPSGGSSGAAGPPSPAGPTTHSGAGAAALADHVGVVGCSSGGSVPGGNARSGDGIHGEAVSCKPLPPLHQLSLLAAFAALRGLPVFRELVTNAVSICPDGSASSPPSSLLAMLPALLQAYLRCRAHAGAAAATGGSCSSAPAGHGPGGGRGAGASAGTSGAAAGGSDNAGGKSGSGGGNDSMRHAASSWERVLLGPLDVAGLVELAAREVVSQYVPFVQPQQTFLAFMLEVLRHLLVAFPSQGRTVMQRKVRTKAGKSLRLQDWLKNSLRTETGPNARHLLELAATVVAGGEPSAQDAAQLLRGGGGCGWAVRLGSLLPPPCFVAAMLPLPLCANPACANLEGDSEAELLRRPESARGGAGASGSGSSGSASGGTVSYCSRTCQLVHRRTGQGGARGGAARAQG